MALNAYKNLTFLCENVKVNQTNTYTGKLNHLHSKEQHIPHVLYKNNNHIEISRLMSKETELAPLWSTKN